MAGKKAQMVFTDPPYNVPIAGHVSGLGRTRHEDFVMASGEMSESELTAFLERSLGNLVAHSMDGSIHFVFMDWRHLGEILAAGRKIYAELKNICVWAKTNAGMGSLYRSQHELVLVFRNGSAPHIDNIELGKFGRTALIQELLRDGKLRPLKIQPKGDKLTRMEAHTATLEAGYVHLPETATWLPDFETEMLQFPRGSRDDQVDSISQFLTWVKQPRSHPSIRRLSRENRPFSTSATHQKRLDFLAQGSVPWS